MSANNPEMLYFGCWGEAGHFLFDEFKRRVRKSSDNRFTDEFLDGNILLPRPERKGEGSFFWIQDWSVLVWWGNPWDKRGAVNNAVLLREICDVNKLWSVFQDRFPKSLTAVVEFPEKVDSS